jgi:hypothetical protein
LNAFQFSLPHFARQFHDPIKKEHAGYHLMNNRFNTTLVNWFLVASFVSLLVIAFSIDIPQLAAEGRLETAMFWILSNIHPQKVVATALSTAAAVVFLFMAMRYRHVQQRKADRYLASLILYAAVYQAISRTMDSYYMVSESDFMGFVYVPMKFYLPLDIMSVILFAIMAFEVFLLPSMEQAGTQRMSRVMGTLGIAGSAIGVVITLFYYLPDDSPVKYVVAGSGIVLYGVILILVLWTAVKIFRLWSRTRQVTALLCMGYQLLLLVGALVFFILVEVGAVLPISNDVLYTFRIAKEAMFLVVAVLYHFAFIKPAREKQP